MTKPKEIIEVGPFYLVCKCTNGELRKLDLAQKLNLKEKFIDKLFQLDIFKTAQIGELGQIYWQNIATIKDIEGNNQACEYDLSPEFFYYNSNLV